MVLRGQGRTLPRWYALTIPLSRSALASSGTAVADGLSLHRAGARARLAKRLKPLPGVLTTRAHPGRQRGSPGRQQPSDFDAGAFREPHHRTRSLSTPQGHQQPMVTTFRSAIGYPSPEPWLHRPVDGKKSRLIEPWWQAAHDLGSPGPRPRCPDGRDEPRLARREAALPLAESALSRLTTLRAIEALEFHQSRHQHQPSYGRPGTTLPGRRRRSRDCPSPWVVAVSLSDRRSS